MQRRLIPVLLLKNGMLYKSIKFNNLTYIGDPINTVRIFNDKEVDELIILDIDASKSNAEPDYKLIESIASEAFMPLAFGGGISTLDIAKKVISAGIEKIILNSGALRNKNLISDISSYFGVQSTVVSVDVKKNFIGRYQIFNYLTRKIIKADLKEYIHDVQLAGAGEILICSVDNDGMMQGYDLSLYEYVSDSISVPLVFCGGASGLKDIKTLFDDAGEVSAAAGSMFVFHGKHKAVLITYPREWSLDEKLLNEV